MIYSKSNTFQILKETWLLLTMKLQSHHDLVSRQRISGSLRMCSVCGNHKPVLSSFMTYHRVSNVCNTTIATSGAENAFSSGAPKFITGITQSLAFCVEFSRSLLVLLYTFCRPLYCLSFDLRLPITPQSQIYGFLLPLAILDLQLPITSW